MCEGADSNSFQEFYSHSASNLLLHVTLKVELRRDRNANAPEGPSWVQMPGWASPLIITAKKLSDWGEIEQPRHTEGWTAATSARRCPSRLNWRLSLINLTVLNLQRNWVKMSGWIQRRLIHLYNDSLAKSSSRAGPVFMHDWPALENFKKRIFSYVSARFWVGSSSEKNISQTLSKGQIKVSDVIQTSVTYINVNISTEETKEVYMFLFKLFCKIPSTMMEFEDAWIISQNNYLHSCHYLTCCEFSKIYGYGYPSERSD